jgi:ubiquitin-protein ligase E3 C
LPFEERVIVFQGLLLNNKIEYQNADAHFMVGSHIHITIRRNYLYEDAFEKLSIENGKYLFIESIFVIII